MAIYEIRSDHEVEAFVSTLKRRFVISIALLLGIVIVSTIGLVVFGRHGGQDHDDG